MKTLYHGSFYNNPVLKPGFIYSGIELSWDDTESNKFLYTTENKDSAILMAIGAFLSKKETLKKFSIKNKTITVQFYAGEPEVIIEPGDLVYLYEILPLPNQHWVKVGNKNNKDFSEFKTDQEIRYDSVSSINILDWIKSNGYKLNYLS